MSRYEETLYGLPGEREAPHQAGWRPWRREFHLYGWKATGVVQCPGILWLLREDRELRRLCGISGMAEGEQKETERKNHHNRTNEMKQLTDYFQSLEMLQAGIPRETADYFFHKGNEYLNSRKRYEPAFPYVPCWSVGAIWEYLHDNSKEVFSFDTDSSTESLVEELVRAACMVARGKGDA